MLKIDKIKNKQKNCNVIGKPRPYMPGEDCLADCRKIGKPAYFKSPYV
ncbi:hypothetical protein [Paraclostridium sordellii]|nr:hypothetical protein [Paeniclostridium sordellii]CEN23630.1 Uncharacterised protein [[Clostridium] sordellii] [Paeniclostridium sordellii]